MKKLLPGIIILALILGAIIGVVFGFKIISELIERRSLQPPAPYKKPVNVQGVQTSSGSGTFVKTHDYTLVLVGDSMTRYLGNSDELRGYLNEYYPDKTFEVLNYGYGGSSLLRLKERFIQNTEHEGRQFQPILNIDYDYIIIESFGHNPLSQYELNDGLKKQTEILDDIVGLIATSSGKQKILFLSTIGTNKDTYVKTSIDLSSSERAKWARERDAYIKNHMEYAKSHNIPLIDAFTPSMDIFGNAKQYLIRDDDFIHPSPKGVLFISKKIADFLAQNNFIK